MLSHATFASPVCLTHGVHRTAQFSTCHPVTSRLPGRTSLRQHFAGEVPPLVQPD